METAVMTSFSSNWNPFFYNLLANADDQRQAASQDTCAYAIERPHATSALSFAFDSAETSPQPSGSSPIRFGCFSSMSMFGSTGSNQFAPKQSDQTTPSSGFIPSDEEHELAGLQLPNAANDDDVFTNDKDSDEPESEDYWRAWNIQTAPGCPALDKLFENKRRWRERFHKSAPPPLQRVCVFCRNTGRPPALFTQHVIRNEKGEITCPVLSSKYCHKCGVKGHTANYCYTSKSTASLSSSTGLASGSSSTTSHKTGQRLRQPHHRRQMNSWR